MKIKVKSLLWISTGLLMVMAAILIYTHNCREDRNAGNQAEEKVEEIKENISQDCDPEGEADNRDNSTEPDADISPGAARSPASSAGSDRGQEDSSMPIITIDGYDYIGYLTIPKLNLELPVMAEWDYPRLKIAPCRQAGSTRTNDLVIAAHNYDSHFGRLKNLETGDTVLFTENDGLVNRYTVSKKEILDPTKPGKVINSGYDLVLYTCTYGGASRVCIFCSKVVNVDNGVVNGGCQWGQVQLTTFLLTMGTGPTDNFFVVSWTCPH